MLDGLKKNWRYTLLGGAAVAALAASFIFGRGTTTPSVVAPIPIAESGWSPVAVVAAKPLVAAMPQFLIVGADPAADNTRANVRLWDATQKVTGAHLPNIAQETGDCVSWGARNAHNYRQCVVIASGGGGNRGPPSKYRGAYAPQIYGVSRVLIGKNQLGRGAGSCGAWAVEGMKAYGVLPEDSPLAPRYSGAVADKWGWKPGPPADVLKESSEFKVLTASLITTPEECRDAICNGYPVTIASNWGTQTIRQRDGRMVAVHNAQWPHQMCVIAYDGSGPQPYWYILNSWGPNAHPAPLQGEPPGGFWVDRKSIAYILAAQDSFAISDLDGFPADDLDFSPLSGAIVPARPQILPAAITPFTLAL